MPWKSIADLPENIRKNLPTKARTIFLNAFNSAWKGGCKDWGIREHEIKTCAFKRAWGVVKFSYRVEGDKWVSKAPINTDPTPFIIAAAQNPMLISGPLIEVNKKNLNDWGIPAEETEIVKAGLLGVPLKKCSGAGAIFNEHSCDYNWKPEDEIGQIVSTHESNGWIHATAKVTDPTADSKIRSGTSCKKVRVGR
ncbi:MAG: ChaB family protein [Methanosarcinales archaeon]|nr:ChaB family protein [Methanosarcinales archaeon]